MHALRNVLSRSTLIKPNRYISSAFKNYAKTDDSGGESNESSANKSESDEDTKFPTPPNNCCMSGCANCVWIQYANDLQDKLHHGTKLAREVIEKEVEDANMRAYLEMELRILESSRKKNNEDSKK